MARRLKKSKKNNQNTSTKTGKSFGRAAVIGLFGGLFWGLMGLICHLLHFSSVGPSLIFSPFRLGAWKHQIGGQFLAIAAIALISVPLALVYQLLLSAFKSIWVGIAFGLLLWCIVFLALQPFIPKLSPVNHLGVNTLTTTLCLFALYGLFIGYSIAFEMEEASNKESYPNT
ncbi:hypothetical protein EWH99_04015 [Sporolactobacillus sp. THM7-7]|nr:hypothetical protein EWH99_04015 [Sporolactobacillus sp. THM7-7]